MHKDSKGRDVGPLQGFVPLTVLFSECVGGSPCEDVLRGNSIGNHAALCERVRFCSGRMVCVCTSTILNYVPVDVQQCLFEKALLESLLACVGEGVHMYCMHVLNYFIHIQSAFVSFPTYHPLFPEHVT